MKLLEGYMGVKPPKNKNDKQDIAPNLRKLARALIALARLQLQEEVETVEQKQEPAA